MTRDDSEVSLEDGDIAARPANLLSNKEQLELYHNQHHLV